ncbi:hypothetical protein JCM10207_003567 [Rhodosporidiobolus poonsookiae]
MRFAIFATVAVLAGFVAAAPAHVEGNGLRMEKKSVKRAAVLEDRSFASQKAAQSSTAPASTKDVESDWWGRKADTRKRSFESVKEQHDGTTAEGKDKDVQSDWFWGRTPDIRERSFKAVKEQQKAAPAEKKKEVDSDWSWGRTPVIRNRAVADEA